MGALLAVMLGASSSRAADEGGANGANGKPRQAAAQDPFIPFPPPSPRVIPPPERAYTYTAPQLHPSLVWMATQLVPSPELAGGRVGRTGIDGVREDATQIAFGLRWQLTPLVWSWGTNRRVTRWRTLVVDPIARNSGSLEVDATFEYLFGHVDRLLVRPGIRVTFPLAQRGEYLSASLGTSTYIYNGAPRLAYDVGAYVLFGLFGVQLTVAPAHAPLSFIGTFRIRYF
jgi:hypothetical protein